MTYDMTAVEPDLDPEAMDTSPLASDMMGTQLTELPPGLLHVGPRRWRRARRPSTPDRFQKAVALQNYFRDNGTLRRSTARLDGNGSDTLEAFLDDGLTGAPDGLLRAVRRGDGRDGPHPQHPEPGGHRLPQADASRSRTPTSTALTTCTRGPSCTSRAPAGCGSSPPRRTEPRRCRRTPSSSSRPRPRPTCPAARGSERRREPARRSVPTPRSRTPRTRPAPAGGGIPWRPIAIGVLAVALLVGLAMLPRLVRRRRRERRLTEGPEPVWIELRDTVVDLGLTWPAGRSPRETGAHLVHYFGRPVGTDTSDRPRHGADVSPEGEVALHRIVSTIEQQRYARPGTDAGGHPQGRRRDRDRRARGRRHARRPPSRRVAAPVAVRLPSPPRPRRGVQERRHDLHRRRRPRRLSLARSALRLGRVSAAATASHGSRLVRPATGAW